MKAAIFNPINEKAEDKAIERTILAPDRSFYDGIYLRNYEPEYIKRVKNGEAPYLNDHLGTEVYNGNPEKVFKGLLRKRNLTTERQRKMNY